MEALQLQTVSLAFVPWCQLWGVLSGGVVLQMVYF